MEPESRNLRALVLYKAHDALLKLNYLKRTASGAFKIDRRSQREILSSILSHLISRDLAFSLFENSYDLFPRPKIIINRKER